MIREFEQCPTDKLDYGFLFGKWLHDDDTILTSLWTVPVALTTSNAGINEEEIVRDGQLQRVHTVTAIWLTGGVLGTRYLIENKITTVQGRIRSRRLRLHITEPQS